MRKAVLLPLLLVLAAPACGGDGLTETPPEDLAGDWRGNTSLAAGGARYDFELRFTQDGADVGGTGRIRVVLRDTARDSAAVSVQGRYDNPGLRLSVEREGFAPLGFDGRIFRAEAQAADSLAGTLNGSGFTGQRLVLRRAP